MLRSKTHTYPITWHFPPDICLGDIKTHVNKKAYTCIVTTARFILANNNNNKSKCPSTGGWKEEKKVLGQIHAMELLSNKNNILLL